MQIIDTCWWHTVVVTNLRFLHLQFFEHLLAVSNNASIIAIALGRSRYLLPIISDLVSRRPACMTWDPFQFFLFLREAQVSEFIRCHKIAVKRSNQHLDSAD